MKSIVLAAAISLAALPSFAGNLGTFVEPAPVTVEEPAPMGGSAAGWVVPLLAVLVIAAVASSGNDDPEPSNTSVLVESR